MPTIDRSRLIRPIKRMLLIGRHTLAKNGAALRDVYDRIFSFCGCHFLAIVFLRFSALAKMARRTSWWLKARGNYGRLSVFNLYSASHPLWQSIWPNVPTKAARVNFESTGFSLA